MQQVSAMIWAHRRLSVALAVGITVAAGLYIKSLPKTYTATATLMVNYETNDPLARTVQTGPLGTYMSTEMQLIESNEVLLPVIDKLGLTKIPGYAAGYSGDSNGLREWVKNNLAKGIEVEQGRLGSQLIYVTAAARDPVLAAAIANTVTETYLDEQKQRVFGPATERARLYSQELAELKHKVALAQEQVTAFRQRTGVTDASVQNNNVEADLLTSLEQRYQDAQNQRRIAEVKAAGDQSLSGGVLGSNLVQGLKSQLNTEESQLAQLRATLGPAHPKVVELQTQINETRKSLNAELQTYTSSTSAELNAARQLENKLAAAVAAQREKVLAVRKLQDEGTKYVLELESAQSVYKRALDGYDQIMFASGDHYTNVNFISRATPAMQATKPNKMKYFLVGSFAGLLIGIIGPFAYELLLNRRVRCRDDFERALNLPVLMEFDAIKPAAGSA
jgi:uncharacterized protein involved in exopolysaccharide biosynthesis